jgi:hypothetical protein
MATWVMQDLCESNAHQTGDNVGSCLIDGHGKEVNSLSFYLLAMANNISSHHEGRGASGLHTLS